MNPPDIAFLVQEHPYPRILRAGAVALIQSLSKGSMETTGYAGMACEGHSGWMTRAAAIDFAALVQRDLYRRTEVSREGTGAMYMSLGCRRGDLVNFSMPGSWDRMGEPDLVVSVEAEGTRVTTAQGNRYTLSDRNGLWMMSGMFALRHEATEFFGHG